MSDTTSIISSDSRCTHLDALHRRCRMNRSASHPSLCEHHATQAQQATEADRLSTALTAPGAGPKTPADINRVLSQLFSAVSLRKIDLRQGALLAYIAQLMIQTTKTSDSQTHLAKTP
jgi:hypothetical protein